MDNLFCWGYQNGIYRALVGILKMEGLFPKRLTLAITKIFSTDFQSVKGSR